MAELHKGTKIFLAIVRPLQRLPLKFHYFWGSVFAWLAEHLIRYRVDETNINLARSFPNKNYYDLKPLVHECYRHLGEIFAEAIWFGGNWKRPGRAHDSHICEVTNAGELFSAFDNKNNVMVLNTHFGNWEITGGFFQYIYDIPREKMPISEDNVCVVYRELSNKFWDDFFRANRCACEDESYEGYIESMKILRHAVANRDNKMMYIFPTDQSPYGAAAYCEIPSFLNQKTKAMIGGASLAHKLGMPVFYMCIDRIERGHYTMSFKKICDDAATMEPSAIMEQYYKFLEEDVVRNPANYNWTHRRWK